jgi:predicted phosphodiesterase
VRVAALYDIHGNLRALDAVLAEVAPEPVDAIVLGGDFAAGPRGPEVVDRLRELGPRAHFLSGNAEREMLDPRYLADDPGAAERLGFVRERLGPERIEFLRALPSGVDLDIDGLGRVLFCHASPRTDMEVMTPRTPEERFRAALSATVADVVVCGHTHMQFRRELDGRTLVNAGSVGMPNERPVGAYWALLGPDIEHRRTPYDVEGAIADAEAVGFPGARGEYAETLREPASAEEAAVFFEQLALERPEFAGAA